MTVAPCQAGIASAVVLADVTSSAPIPADSLCFILTVGVAARFIQRRVRRQRPGPGTLLCLMCVSSRFVQVGGSGRSLLELVSGVDRVL